MSRHSRKPRRSVRAEPVTSPLHYRDPETNERSVCGAEESALYVGEEVVSTRDLADVTCVKCKATPAYVIASLDWPLSSYTESGKELAKSIAPELLAIVERIESTLTTDGVPGRLLQEFTWSFLAELGRMIVHRRLP